MGDKSFLGLEVDKPAYVAGEAVNGVVHAHIAASMKVRTLDVYLLGREKVVIDPPVAYAGGSHKAHYSSTNEMLNVGLRLVENKQLEPGDMSLPFQFHLPPSALASYVGSYAAVNWKLWARADVPWESDLSVENFLTVETAILETPAPVSIENRETAPHVRVELSSSIIEPSEAVIGKILLLDPGSLRSLRIQITITEDATARGTFTDAHKNQTRGVGPVLEFRREQFQGDSPIPFRLEIPQGAPSSYRGTYSSIGWSVAIVLDIPHTEDVHVHAPFRVGLRRKPEVQPQAPIALEAARGTATLETTRAYPSPTEPASVSAQTQIGQLQVDSKPAVTGDSSTDDVSSLILQILGDGGSEDLLTISTELQLKSSGFVDLNTIRKLCESLVEQGRLKRTGEGEFFAKYAINAPGPAEHLSSFPTN